MEIKNKNNIMSRLLGNFGLLALYLGMAAIYSPNRSSISHIETSDSYKEDNSPAAKGLKLYMCNGKKFFAHNEREAIKRAKQRGLWKEGSEVTLV